MNRFCDRREKFCVLNQMIRIWRPSTGAFLGALFALLISAPFCGWAFSCGCDWPWRGLIAHCNYFLAGAPEKCPWCLHTLAGVIAVAGAMLIGAVAGGDRFASKRLAARVLMVVAVVPAFLLIWAGITGWYFDIF